MKYRYLEARGYWDDNSHNAFDVKIAIDRWDGNDECEDDMQMFTYQTDFRIQGEKLEEYQNKFFCIASCA